MHLQGQHHHSASCLAQEFATVLCNWVFIVLAANACFVHGDIRLAIHKHVTATEDSASSQGGAAAVPKKGRRPPFSRAAVWECIRQKTRRPELPLLSCVRFSLDHFPLTGNSSEKFHIEEIVQNKLRWMTDLPDVKFFPKVSLLCRSYKVRKYGR